MFGKHDMPRVHYQPCHLHAHPSFLVPVGCLSFFVETPKNHLMRLKNVLIL